MDSRILLVGGLIVTAFVTQGCQQAREAFGFEKSAPDEFAVVSRAPLSLPPEYGLRPPKPGAKRPQEKVATERAKDTLLSTGRLLPVQGNRVEQGPMSPGERALLKSASAGHAELGIRRTVDRETAQLIADERSFVNRLIFWQRPPPPGSVVDPTKESKRLRENAALGESPTKGETVVIERKKKGLLEGIF